MTSITAWLRIASLLAAVSCVACVAPTPTAGGTSSSDSAVRRTGDDALVERGRYLATIAGCNDCHTPGYASSGGKVDERQWLTGDALGWQGPWGTTYAANLRLSLQRFSEDEWVRFSRTTQLRPPMPWFALRDMTEQDLRAFYRFVRYLGPAGQPAPAYVPPGTNAPGPVVQFPAPPK